MENEDFWARKSKKGSKMIKKHCLEKVFATRFQTSKTLINPIQNTVFKMRKRVAGNLIKPIEIEDFRGRFRIFASKLPKKHYVFTTSLKPFFTFAKHQKTVSKTVFWSIQKGCSKYLIKPIEF